MSYQIAINVYSGHWTLLEDLRSIVVSDDEIKMIDEDPKLGKEIASNFGKRIELEQATEPAKQPVRCDYCGQAAILGDDGLMVHLAPMLEPCDAPWTP